MNDLYGLSAAEVVAKLGLEPLAGEGGFWKAVVRTEAMNSIYFLMTDADDGYSALHRLKVTEGWQWVAGDAVEMMQISADGELKQIELNENETHTIVPIDAWQAARTTGRWSLVTCWCAPAFQEEHFELGNRTNLMNDFPQFGAEIVRFTR
jgi:predicted cupin superfamily sugar epimerase